MSHIPGDLELSDERVPKASFSTINFALIEARNPAELMNLLRACQTHGFFYLNFDNSEATKSIVEDKTRVQSFMKKYFAQPMDVKMQDHQGIKTKGYIPYGTLTGLRKGDWRTVEQLILSRWDFVSGDNTVPPAVQAEHALFSAYLERCNYVVGLQDQRFDRGHDTSKPCDTMLAMLSYPHDIGETLQEHTDMGSLTILFSQEYGLQVLAPEKQQWEFVEPQDCHAVINVGDALRFMSDKKLYSCLHRDFKYRDTNGREITAKEWQDSKYKFYHTPHEEQDNSVILGGMESVLAEEAHAVTA
ncbi:hypothetical protein K438DRAFT_1880023 [Mycena galopus ATCC 62051]|nr:hypothetical protein K438DRAFT_1880023 [Mycena galopus ATCC 62051]